MRSIYFRTDWSRVLEKVKKDHADWYSKIRFVTIDIGRDITPKMDFHWLKAAIIPNRIKRAIYQNYKILHRSPQKINRDYIITSFNYALTGNKELDKRGIEKLKEMAHKLGYSRIVRRDNTTWDIYR